MLFPAVKCVVIDIVAENNIKDYGNKLSFYIVFDMLTFCAIFN